MDQYTPFGSGNGQQTPSGEESDDIDMDLDQEPEQETKQARLAYMKSIVPPTPARSKWPIIILVIIVLVGLTGGGYFYYMHHKAAKPVKRTTASQTVAPSTTPVSTTTTHYVSNGSDLNLDFDYPSNWTVMPASNDNPSDNTITITSPLTKITTATGANVTGRVIVSIRPGSAQMTELSSSNATTGQASVQIAYNKPASDQYQYPYLTFIHLLPGNDTDSAFEEVLVSGTTQLPKGSSVTESSVSVDPIISASFYSCNTSTCAGSSASPLSITNDTWQNDTVFQQTLALFESMQLN